MHGIYHAVQASPVILTCFQSLQVGGKLSSEDKSTIEKSVEDTIQWLDGNQLAEVDELEAKLKELESTCSPIVSKIYGQGAPDEAAGGMGGMPGAGGAAASEEKSGGAGPKIEVCCPLRARFLTEICSCRSIHLGCFAAFLSREDFYLLSNLSLNSILYDQCIQ